MSNILIFWLLATPAAMPILAITFVMTFKIKELKGLNLLYTLFMLLSLWWGIYFLIK